MGLFDGAFNPNLGWLGQALQQPDQQQPSQQQDPSMLAKLGLLFSDPFGKAQPFAGGLMSPGSDLNRFSQLFTDPFGSQNPFPGAIGARSQGGPSTNPADYAGLADAFGGSGPNGNMPPLGAPRTIAPSPTDNTPSLQAQPSGPTLDQRAYGSQGPAGPMVPPSVAGGVQQMPPQAQSAMAQAPQESGPGIGDRLNAGFQGFAHGGALLPALGNLIGGISSGQRQDAAGLPKIMETGTDPNTGQKTFAWVNSQNQTITPATGAAGGNPGQNNGFLAPGTPYLNSAATGEDYLKQWSPEVQTAAKAYLAGNIVPTGNPRQNALASKAKEVAIKYGNDMGIPFSDARYSEARKFRTELGSTQANTVGGQAKAFAQGTEHMVKLADTLEKLDNSNGFGIPALADGINTMRQWASTDQSAISDKARSIGQTLSGEIGKLFSGSAGGGVEERRLTRDRFDTVKSPKQLAAALEATLETMHGGLAALEQRRDQVLGPQGADVKFVDEKTAANIARIEQMITKLKGDTAASGPKPGVTSNGVKWSVQ